MRACPICEIDIPAHLFSIPASHYVPPLEGPGWKALRAYSHPRKYYCPQCGAKNAPVRWAVGKLEHQGAKKYYRCKHCEFGVRMNQ